MGAKKNTYFLKICRKYLRNLMRQAPYFNLIKYEEQTWNMGGNIEIVFLVSGLQSSSSKYHCCSCLRDSRGMQDVNMDRKKMDV